MRATPFRRSPHLCCKASSKWPQLSPRGLSKTVGRHTEARREWNGVVSTKNMRQIESKESQKTPPAAQKMLFHFYLPAVLFARLAPWFSNYMYMYSQQISQSPARVVLVGDSHQWQNIFCTNQLTTPFSTHHPLFAHCKEWRPSFSVSWVCYSLSSIMWLRFQSSCMESITIHALNNEWPLYLHPIFASIYNNPGDNERRPRVLPTH
jgi:hypothetical protein